MAACNGRAGLHTTVWVHVGNFGGVAATGVTATPVVQTGGPPVRDATPSRRLVAATGPALVRILFRGTIALMVRTIPSLLAPLRQRVMVRNSLPTVAPLGYWCQLLTLLKHILWHHGCAPQHCDVGQSLCKQVLQHQRGPASTHALSQAHQRCAKVLRNDPLVDIALMPAARAVIVCGMAAADANLQ
jgi:hypothetical protein